MSGDHLRIIDPQLGINGEQSVVGGCRLSARQLDVGTNDASTRPDPVGQRLPGRHVSAADAVVASPLTDPAAPPQALRTTGKGRTVTRRTRRPKPRLTAMAEPPPSVPTVAVTDDQNLKQDVTGRNRPDANRYQVLAPPKWIPPELPRWVPPRSTWPPEHPRRRHLGAAGSAARRDFVRTLRAAEARFRSADTIDAVS